MANKLIYPVINPVQLFDPNPVLADRYRSRDFIDFPLPDTILPWQQELDYAQPWQKSDSIYIQMQTNVGPVAFNLKRSDGSAVASVLFTQNGQSLNDPTMFIYELNMPLNIYDEGCYYGEITFGISPVVFTLRTSKLDLKVEHAQSLLLQYKHFEYREDFIFETGIQPEMRIFGTNRYERTANKSTTYEDQVLNVQALRNVAFRTWMLLIGRGKGIPDWMADKIARIIGCSTFMIDANSFTKPSDSEMEPNGVDNYPMRGWKVLLRERYNRASRQYENNIPLNAQLVVMINSDSKGFGNSNSGSQTAVLDIQ